MLVTSVALVRCLLGLVFAASCLGKALDPAGTLVAVQEYGVGPRWGRPAAAFLPVLEAALAVCLLIGVEPTPVALAAWLALAVFLAAVARVMTQGKAMDCHCFGALRREPVGATTVMRLIALLALATLLLALYAIRGVGAMQPVLGDADIGAILPALVTVSALGVAAYIIWELLVLERRTSGRFRRVISGRRRVALGGGQ